MGYNNKKTLADAGVFLYNLIQLCKKKLTIAREFNSELIGASTNKNKFLIILPLYDIRSLRHHLPLFFQ